jgi:hypothetical protein
LRRRPCVQIEHGDGLLFRIRGRVELDSIAAVDADEITAATILCGVVRAADECNGQRADGGTARGGIHDERTGRRYRSTFRCRLGRDRTVLGKRERAGTESYNAKRRQRAR